MKRTKHRIVWQGQEHVLGITAISKLTGRSRTFIDARLQDGLSIQQAIDAEPGDPQYKKNRRPERLRGQDWLAGVDRENQEKAFRKENKSIINKFLLGGSPCSN